jgi:hypothetical protein
MDMKRLNTLFPLAAGLLASCGAQPAQSQETAPPAVTVPDTVVLPERIQKLPKKIFAHYMACWPAGAGPLACARGEEYKHFRHDSKNPAYRFGAHIRNWDLVPPGTKLTLEESADLEIRRALRIGIDGFTIDAWAGGNDAKATLDALFKVAEAKNYPFEITITPDPNSLQGSSAADAIKYLLEKHGDSPKLARRDGKPLIFGYQSVFVAMQNGEDAYKDHPEVKGTWIWNTPEWRTTAQGFEYMGRAMETLQKKVGRPLYLEFAMEAMNYGIKGGKLTDDQKVEAGGILAKHVGAVGAWSWLGPKQDEIARNVIANGAEWGQPVGVGQKENIPWESYGAPGFDWMQWAPGAIRNQSTLIQFITWNDYGENSNLAPAYNTRYGLYDLHGYMVKWWKDGKPPTPDHDRVYVGYHKYPVGAKVYPFKEKFKRKKKVLEVLTILPKPATIRLPGREVDGKPIEYSAPAGLHREQFPNTPGEVEVELVRNGKVALKLHSPEPITDKPFREDNGIVVYSSEEARNWKADFGNTPQFEYSEYGDDDHDGLPNWFEMYWFGTWLDFSTDTIADPNADPDNDGQTNLQEYQAQTDPTLSPEEEKLAGTLPLSYLKHRARGEVLQAGKATLPFANASFEEAGSTPEDAAGWTLKNGAVRSQEKVSSGHWALKLPAGENGMSHAMQSMGSGIGYSWNSDPLNEYALRAGCVVGYAVDVASGKDGVLRNGYMRLAHNPNAGGYQMWGIPIVSTDKAQYSRRSIAHLLNPNFVAPGGAMGGTWGNQVLGGGDKTTALYLDNFSPLTLLRPQLQISDTAPISLKNVAPSTPATSAAIRISNAQTETLPRQLKADEPVEQTATILYGAADFVRDDKDGFKQIINGKTDDVGALLLGKNANLFEFVSPHCGATPQQLKLIGVDEKSGLAGGPQPESEAVVVRFKGAPQPGEYSATLRIVTQAANTGTLSMAKPGEPPYNLFYVDIPVKVAVQ